MKRYLISVLAFLLLSIPALAADITANGMYQKDLHTFLTNVTSLVNEIRTDAATNKTSLDAIETLIEELAADHATFRSAVTGNEAAVEELIDDHATFKTVVDELITDHANMVTLGKSDAILNATALSTGSTPENIASTAFQFQIDGVPALKAAVAAGTAFTAADTINTGAAGGTFWGVWAVQIVAAGTITTKSPGADQTYANEAAAIAALPTADALNVVIGYVTIECNTAAAWTAQTDDITNGSDNTSVNFYNTASSVPATLSAATPATLTASDPPSAPAALSASNPASGPATISASALSLSDL